MLALRSFFGYRKIRCLFGIRRMGPSANSAPQLIPDVSHAAHEASARNTNLPLELLRAKRLRAELRGDRRAIPVFVARDGARAPLQSGAEGLHQALVQREPGHRDSPHGGDAPRHRAARAW